MISHGDSQSPPQSMRLRMALALLAVAFLPVVPIAAYVLYLQYGTAGVAVALTSAAICWLAGTLALLVTALYTWLGNPIAAALGPMMFRMGFPLAACAVCAVASPWMMQAAFPLTCALFYLYMLFVETLLSLRLTAKSSATAIPSENSKVVEG